MAVVLFPKAVPNITPKNQSAPPLRKSGYMAKLWPNGEIVIWNPRKLEGSAFRTGSNTLPSQNADPSSVDADDINGEDWPQAMGLANVNNFDKEEKPLARYGLKGISSKGRRRIRNACYLVEHDVPKERLTFATVTLPPMPPGEMLKVHQGWHKVVDAYRREIARQLRRYGLPGEVIGVTEIQPKRYAETGYPILHGHFVFIGATKRGKWAISPEQHDQIWTRALSAALGYCLLDVSVACQLKPVKKSAEKYLSKYMSKGAEQISEVVSDGFAEWMPKQWWSMARTLTKRIDRELRILGHGIGWLISTMDDKNPYLWRYKKDITRENKEGVEVWVALVAKLTAQGNSMVRKVLELRPPDTPVEHYGFG